MEKTIEITGLKKSYGEVRAVKGISFYVEKGKLFAFLGPNGAGKSTTINIISTALEPDEGQVSINGHTLGADDNRIRASIGVVFQESLLDPLLTVRENLLTRGSFYGLDKKDLKEAVDKAARQTGVEEFLDRPYGKLSGGQRRRSDIARALVNTPEILFLDEPTSGLDPQTRRNIWDAIRNIQKNSRTTVFLTTHYMEEASEADYVIIIDNGEIAAKGTPTQLKEKYASDLLKIKTSSMESIKTILDDMKLSYTTIADLILVDIAHTRDAIPVLESCREHIESFEVLMGTMEDAFIGITGKEIRE